jgi:type I site-specific restriction-modification system R (restriction) subunit
MAWDELRAQFQKDAEVNLIQAVARLDSLYDEVSEAGYDYNTRANVLRDKHKLLGLYTEKQEVKSDINIKFDFDE